MRYCSGSSWLYSLANSSEGANTTAYQTNVVPMLNHTKNGLKRHPKEHPNVFENNCATSHSQDSGHEMQPLNKETLEAREKPLKVIIHEQYHSQHETKVSFAQ